MLEHQRHLMKSVLDDSRLNRLRLEGGTVLARIRKEEASESDNYRCVGPSAGPSGVTLPREENPPAGLAVISAG